MNLADYLETSDRTVTEFARKVQISRVSVSRILHGKQTPSADLMRRIRTETKGAVSADDFIHPAPAEQERRAG